MHLVGCFIRNNQLDTKLLLWYMKKHVSLKHPKRLTPVTWLYILEQVSSTGGACTTEPLVVVAESLVLHQVSYTREL